MKDDTKKYQRPVTVEWAREREVKYFVSGPSATNESATLPICHWNNLEYIITEFHELLEFSAN
jgi:hypothetical protein